MLGGLYNLIYYNKYVYDFSLVYRIGIYKVLLYKLLGLERDNYCMGKL